jgi:hypothetical protein
MMVSNIDNIVQDSVDDIARYLEIPGDIHTTSAEVGIRNESWIDRLLKALTIRSKTMKIRMKPFVDYIR